MPRLAPVTSAVWFSSFILAPCQLGAACPSWCVPLRASVMASRPSRKCRPIDKSHGFHTMGAFSRPSHSRSNSRNGGAMKASAQTARRARVWLASGFVLALSVMLFGCDAPGAAPPPTEVSIGAVVPVTGRYAAGGAQVKNGYELGVQDINAAGGVNINGAKVPLKLTLLDDESDASKTVQRMETLYNDNKIVTYLGGFGSDLHAAAAAIAEKNKTP